MKLSKLKPSDKFYWKGNKYSVFFTLKNPRVGGYKIPCMDWPKCSKVIDMPSGRKIKPIIRCVAGQC